MTARPQVSVLMPMRNAADFVREALDSVLSQDGADREVIVIDDGSSDGSFDLVRSLGDDRIRLLEGPGLGNIAHTLNAGLAQCRGGLLMRCDADDRFEPGRLAWQTRWMADHPDHAAVCGGFMTMDLRGHEVDRMQCGDHACDITAELQAGDTRTHLGAFAVRMAAARRLGGFRPYFSCAEDIDFQLRLGGLGSVGYEPICCYRYRLHDASITHTQATVKREFLTEAARQFAVQRRQTGGDDLERGAAASPPQDVGAACSAGEQMQGILMGRAWREWGAGRRWLACRTGVRAVALRPGSAAAWRSLAALCVKPRRGGGGS